MSITVKERLTSGEEVSFGRAMWGLFTVVWLCVFACLVFPTVDEEASANATRSNVEIRCDADIEENLEYHVDGCSHRVEYSSRQRIAFVCVAIMGALVWAIPLLGEPLRHEFRERIEDGSGVRVRRYKRFRSF